MDANLIARILELCDRACGASLALLWLACGPVSETVRLRQAIAYSERRRERQDLR
ncbi:MAG: hypothetical protein J2P28_16440 [Actinobacteria bacterium]|nr:hypothetical protein [Actinomycetota bacterium]